MVGAVVQGPGTARLQRQARCQHRGHGDTALKPCAARPHNQNHNARSVLHVRCDGVRTQQALDKHTKMGWAARKVSVMTGTVARALRHTPHIRARGTPRALPTRARHSITTFKRVTNTGSSVGLRKAHQAPGGRSLLSVLSRCAAGTSHCPQAAPPLTAAPARHRCPIVRRTHTASTWQASRWHTRHSSTQGVVVGPTCLPRW